MSAALISMVSAFLVVNNLFPTLLNWFLPTIIGTVFIVFSLKKYVPKRVVSSLSTSVAMCILTLAFNHGNAQNTALPNEKIFTKTQMVADYELLYSSLVNYHPTPFLYTPEKELKSYFE